jgi:hypothetical protein
VTAGRGRALRAAVALVCAAAAVIALRANDGLQRNVDRNERLYFPSGRFLREAACGYREMAADYLWFQTVQYYGGYRKGEHDMRYFELLVDAVVRLDPRFVEAYYFASLVASLDFGDVPRAVDILRRGILHNPHTAALPFNVGFLHWVFTKNYPRARLWFDVAAGLPDATEFHQRFAAYARRKAGDLEGSRALWLHLRDTAASADLRRVAEEHLARVEAELARRRAVGQAEESSEPEVEP